jgi:hypothetical protein
VQPVVLGDFTWTAAAKLAMASAIGYMLHRHALQLLSELED